MNAASGWRIGCDVWPSAVVVASWILLALLGFPMPHVDDVWYVDPAINVALTGKLEAPALARVLAAFGTPHFFLSFPLYPLLLGAWLGVLGVSTVAVIGFWATCGVAGSLSLRVLLRAFGAGQCAQALALVYFACHVQKYGLRPEASGYALALGGAAVLTRATFWRLFWGFVLMGAAMLAAPNLAVVAPGLALTTLAVQRREPGLVRRVLGAGFAAGALLGALFLLAIDFRLAEFLRQVSAMSRATFERSQALRYFVEELFGRGFAKVRMGPLYLAYLPLVVVAASRSERWLSARARVLTLGVGATLLATLVYRGRSFDVLNPLVFGSLAVAAGSRPRLRAGWPSHVALAVVVFCAAVTDLLACALQRSPGRAAYAEIRRRAQALAGRVVVDEYAARYVFDFRYPRDALSFHHQRALDDPSGFEARADFKRGGESWVVSSASLCHFAPTLAARPCVSPTFLGRSLKSAFADALIIDVLE